MDGSPGVTGAIGPTGPTGATGATGETGATGINAGGLCGAEVFGSILGQPVDFPVGPASAACATGLFCASQDVRDVLGNTIYTCEDIANGVLGDATNECGFGQDPGEPCLGPQVGLTCTIVDISGTPDFYCLEEFRQD